MTKQEGRIELRDFGVFRKAWRARNPRTVERVSIPPRAGITFKPGRERVRHAREPFHS